MVFREICVWWIERDGLELVEKKGRNQQGESSITRHSNQRNKSKPKKQQERRSKNREAQEAQEGLRRRTEKKEKKEKKKKKIIPTVSLLVQTTSSFSGQYASHKPRFLHGVGSFQVHWE